MEVTGCLPFLLPREGISYGLGYDEELGHAQDDGNFTTCIQVQN